MYDRTPDCPPSATGENRKLIVQVAAAANEVAPVGQVLLVTVKRALLFEALPKNTALADEFVIVIDLLETCPAAMSP